MDFGLTPEELLQKKKLFAARSLYIDVTNKQELFKVALEVFASHYGHALYVVDHWLEDAEVVNERITMLSTGAGFEDRDRIRKKLEDALMKIVETGLFAEDRIKAAKELAVISGIIQENKTTINNNVQNNITSNKVMIVKDHGSDDEWEAKLIAQQERLTANASESRTIN